MAACKACQGRTPCSTGSCAQQFVERAHADIVCAHALPVLGSGATLLRAGAQQTARAPRDCERDGAGGAPRPRGGRSGAGRLPGAHGLARERRLRLTRRSIVYWGAGRVTARRRCCDAGGAADARGGRRRAGALPGHARPAGRVCGRDAGLPRRGPRAHARAVRAPCGRSRLRAARGAASWGAFGLDQACRVLTGHITRQCGVGADCAAPRSRHLRGARPCQLHAGGMT